MSDYILELKDIVKRFSGVVALNHVQFQLKKGEIHALMGENGAGKSTFIKVITGVHAPDEGEIILKGEKVTFANPKRSIRPQHCSYLSAFNRIPPSYRCGEYFCRPL